ncbi:MAG: uracil-DNA glycosylase, partial [Alphaproteobacteria bacterium]
MATPYPFDPTADCALCPRLAAFRETNRMTLPDGFNGAVPSFGDANAWLLIVGLAPGLKGANRTGRPFTGDYAGSLLYATLVKFGLANGQYRQRADDGLRLHSCLISNAVRCVPPQNKPTGAEIARCQPFLAATIAGLPRLTHILALGKIAHDAALRTLSARLSHHPFRHGALHRIGGLTLADSYHCSRYNTNT